VEAVGLVPAGERDVALVRQAAIRLAERLPPSDAEDVITTLSRTVHHGRTPPPSLDLTGSR
jgi:hypothetical protein